MKTTDQAILIVLLAGAGENVKPLGLKRIANLVRPSRTP